MLRPLKERQHQFLRALGLSEEVFLAEVVPKITKKGYRMDKRTNNAKQDGARILFLGERAAVHAHRKAGTRK